MDFFALFKWDVEPTTTSKSTPTSTSTTGFCHFVYVNRYYDLSLNLLSGVRIPRTALPATSRIDHFTVVCSVTWPLDGSEAGGDLVLIQTSLLLLCKTSCSDAY